MSEIKQYVRDLMNQEAVNSPFLVNDKQILKDKKGKSYLNLTLSDRSGQLNARMWDKVEECSSLFNAGDFVKVKGHVQVFQNKKQIVIHDLKRLNPAEVLIQDFLPSSQNPPEQTLERILSYVQQIKDEKIKLVLTDTLTAEKNKKNLLKAPAAKSIHHAYVGGLLDHILSICQIMDFMAGHYKILNRDLLIFGAIFRDIGKIRELSLENGIQYTTEGRLIGHMAIALEMIDEVFTNHKIVDDELKSILKHIVLSHHGKLEYGSPKRPKFLEALVVSMIDELDSRIHSIESFMKSELAQDNSWSQYNPQYDRYFYLDILKKHI